MCVWLVRFVVIDFSYTISIRIFFYPNIEFLQSKLNGTYVNEVKIEERSELKHNDVIGLGCNQATLNDPEEIPTCTKDQMFVYRLINKAAPCETFKTVIHDAVIPIEISDDDDDDDANDIKPVISNGIVKMEPTKNTNGANRLDINLSPRRNAGMLVF